MTKEQLIAAGLSPDQADAVLKMHTASIDGNYIPKATFEVERDKVKTLTADIATRDTQIKELGAFKGTAEQLQTKVTELETKNTADKATYDAKLTEITNNAVITAELQGKVHDVGDVISKLDFSKIVFKDGKVASGFTEQVETLKKEKPHYFTEQKATTDQSGMFPPGFVVGGKAPAESTKQEPAAKGSDASEFGKALANFNLQGASSAVKAEDHYFK